MAEESVRLKGVQYVIDSAGKRTAVLISLEEWGELWEDIYDALVSQARKDEPAVAWETLKAEMTPEALPGV
jgi:PHD/YefM family antitoxin component YafN of YafNO toxin-antitoxin module